MNFVLEKTVSWEEFSNLLKDEKFFICSSEESGYITTTNRSKFDVDGEMFWFEYDFTFYKSENLEVDFGGGWFKLRIRREEREPIIEYIADDGSPIYKTYYDGYQDQIETKGTGKFYYDFYYIGALQLKTQFTT